jgi:metal-responsive CopG/Arc/MetJ family transcriptional regulator
MQESCVTAEPVRTTLALPAELLEATDKAVREGKARSRNELVATALRRELAARRRAEIDAEIAEMANDARYRRESERIMVEFAKADSETVRKLDIEYGIYPYDEDELAEIAATEARMVGQP